MHWNGSSWKVIPFSSPGQFAPYDILDVKPTNAWAVGTHYLANGSVDRLQIEHWNGAAWSEFPAPFPAGGFSLDAVDGASASDVWAVGTYVDAGNIRILTMHFNGTAWSFVPAPVPVLSSSNIYIGGVADISTTDAWVTGTSSIGGYSIFAMHWNGTTWTIVPTPAPVGDNSYTAGGVSGAAANDVWIVGSNVTTAIAYHWNGNVWSQVATPNPEPSNWFTGVAAVSSSLTWAVGWSSGPFPGIPDPRAARWDGTSWSASPVTNPAPGSRVSLSDVDALPNGQVVAVGKIYGDPHTFVLRGCEPATPL